jgi:hypothetical protein
MTCVYPTSNFEPICGNTCAFSESELPLDVSSRTSMTDLGAVPVQNVTQDTSSAVRRPVLAAFFQVNPAPPVVSVDETNPQTIAEMVWRRVL